MDVRSPLYQNIALIVAGVLFLNPIVATAAQLAVDQAAAGNTAVTQAQNGVPMVNIATPNGSGLSHNKFTDYNVGQQGLILNNSAQNVVQTQLGGYVVGNPNLKNGAAGLILNEVTGGNASQLRGYTEVAGRSAAVIVANPHGITCDGCGFINTPRVTLSTGSPVVEDGRLQRFDVDGGQISIEGAGLNAGNVDQFDLITRSAQINAELHAKKLNIITGRNDVDATTLAATAKADDGSDKPMLAIDSSALGGMYAGAIRLVGTEQGVGVKLAGDMAASAGDIQIDANGKLSLAQTSASGNLAIQAGEVDLTGKTYAAGKADIGAQGPIEVRQSLAAAGNVRLEAGQVLNQGVVEAGVRADNSRTEADLSLEAQQVRNTGTLIGNRQLQVKASQRLDNQGGTLSAKTLTRVEAEQVDNRQGRVLSDVAVSVTAQEVNNRSGQMAAKQVDIALEAEGELDNRQGTLFAQERLGVTAGHLDNSAKGTLASQGSLAVTLTGHLDNHDQGTLISQGSQRLSAASVDNSADGLLASRSSLSLNKAATDNRGGRIQADGALSLNQGSLDNQGGTLSGKDSVTLELISLDNRNQGQVSAKGNLDAKIAHLQQANGGELLSQGRLNLEGKRLDNRQGGLIAATEALQVVASEALFNAGGEISTSGSAVVRAQADSDQPAAVLDNSGAGLIVADQGLELYVQRLLNNAKGVLAGRDGLLVRGGSLDNSDGGTLTSQRVIDVRVDGALNNQGEGRMLAADGLQIEAGSIDNRAAGLLSSGAALSVAGGNLNNQGGKVVSDGQLSIRNSNLKNDQAGLISAGRALNIETGTLDNQQNGLISGGAEVTLQAGQLNNHGKGRIAAKGTVQVSATALDQHAGGELISESALTLDLQGGDLDNSGQGLIATPGALLLKNLGKVDNSAGGEISSSQGFLLKAGELNNSAGRVISTQDLELQITRVLKNSLKGVLSAGSLEVTAASLDNSAAGVLASKGDMQVKLTGKLDNHDQGTLSAAQALTVAAAELDNSDAGLLASGADLQLVTGDLNNHGGSLLSLAGFVLKSDDLDNRDGVISSRQALNVTAGTVDNRDNGLITSADTLDLKASSLDSSRDLGKSGGELSAKNDLQLTVTKLIQRQGRLIGEAGVRIDLKGGDLDNRGGLLTASGPLSLQALGKLDNRDGGEVSSKLGYQLHANTIDNGEQGRIISAGKLGLDMGTGDLRNAAGGLISGWQGVDIAAGSLDNSALGTVSSRDGALTVKLDGEQRVLNNSGEGALVSKGRLEVEATSLDNSAKGIVSSSGDLDLRLSGTLDNSGHGLIDTQGSLTANAGAVYNNTGQISSTKAASLDATSLDNQAGQLSSGAALDLTLTGNLLNGQQGKLASVGPLMLKAQVIDNQSGSLISQSLLDLTASSLNNADGGTVTARNGLSLLLTGALNNANTGLIHSQLGSIGIRAERLDNTAGSLSSQGNLLLTLDGKLENQNGQIQSRAGNLDLKRAASVENHGGVLSSLTGWLKLASSGLFDNDGGTTQAQMLDIEARGLNNRGGHISALAGTTSVDLGNATFNNQGGGLYAHQLLDVIAGDFNNQGAASELGGKVAAEHIDFGLSGALNNAYGLVESASSLILTSTGLDNRFGSLRALGSSGDTRITAGSLDNRDGRIETANTNLVLGAASLQNSGGSILHVGTGNFGLSAAQVMGAGGDLSTNGVLSLTADTWTNSSVLQAGRLVLNIGNFTQTATGKLLASQSLTGSGGTWVNDGLLASDDTLSLDLSGAYSGTGRVTSLGNLSLKAANIDLGDSAHISGGQQVSVISNTLLENRGRITAAGGMTLRADTLNNYGTLGSTDLLNIYASTLLNENALIFSGSDMALRVDSFVNRYADVYSQGGLSIARDDQLASADSIENISATLESAGDLMLDVKSLLNRKDKFLVDVVLESASIGVRCYSCSSVPSRGADSHLIWMEEFKTKVVDDSERASILSGRDLFIRAGSVDNERSAIAAANNVSITSVSFKNEGSSSGGYTRYKYLALTPGESLWREIVNFNSFNDIGYDRDLRFWNSSMTESRVKSYFRVAGFKPPDRELTQYFGSMALYHGFTNLQGSGVVNDFGASERYGLVTFSPSNYHSGIRVSAPVSVMNATPFSELVIEGGAGVSAPALVQAGGSLSISATDSINNSVVSEGVVYLLGPDRVANADASGIGRATVVRLNQQLPPDLQQQQISPLDLPGFALPQGGNGLFRLSAQGGQLANVGSALDFIAADEQAPQIVSVSAGQSSSSAAAVNGSNWQVKDAQGADVATVPSADLAAVVGVKDLPAYSAPAVRHKYLIETNPALTDLKQFVSSDYLLGYLGYDPDQVQKRLGDGLYEQRLVREAIMARTGQRYLAGLTSDEAMFRYLMDNAVASKDQLGLSLGVTLSAEQVGALTHDIVWLEEYEVAGEKVLVPVLYLAQAKGRLAANGALIQGRDVTLISGGELLNQGTLRASDNLTATVGNISNSGLVEAGNRLQLLATDSIRNAQGGIIAGRDVSLTALTGDVINERSVTRHQTQYGNTRTIQDFVDSAARIEAANDLSVVAGRDFSNLGGVLDSRGDLAIDAGRDVNISSVEARVSQARGSHYLNERVSQVGAQVSAGRDLDISAGRDLDVIASRLESGRDVALAAGNDALITSAANESHFLSKSKKVTQSRDQITQQSSEIHAGRDLSLDVDNDLTIVASRVRAENDMDIDAGNDVQVLSAKDESASFYFKKKKGSFGRSSSKQKESYHSTNIASVLEAGNDLTINTSKAEDGGLNIDGGRDVTVIGSQLNAGNDLLVGATGDVAVLSGVEEHGSYSKKKKSGFLGLSKSGKSQLKTSATQVASELEAGNDVVIAAGNDIRLRASTTEAGNDVELRSGLIKETGDINLVSANDAAYSLTEQYKKKTGLSVSGGMLSVFSAKKAGREARSSTSVGSHVAAERDASLLAERDINVIGSSVTAGRNLLLDAGRDVNVAATQDQQGSRTWKRERQTGIGLDSDRNGFTAFVGNDVQIEKGLNTRQTAASSRLEGGNDLDVRAGRDANLSGSDLSAGRDINVLAEHDINLDAATERYFQEQQELHQRNGLTVNISHNFGNTVDAIKGIGQGDNLISQVSGVLKAADAVTQFVSGPTTANHLGTTRQQTTTTDGVLSNRPTAMDAGRDVNLQAGNDINAKGSQIQAERDITMSGRDITLDVAHGQQTNGTKQVISQNGINSGTTFNSARTGIGGSHGVHREEGTQGTALATQLQAGRDIHLDASRDLELIGTRAEAGRDISLVAGNDIDIRAAQNDSEHEMRRKSGGGEVGVALGGQDFISVYASVDIGKGRLDRETGKQQEAYLYAGKQLNFESGRDSTVAGARLEGQDVIGRVGRDLLVSSVPDTGKVSGKELDASLTVSVGLYGSVSVSGSVGVGKTSGSTNWVENQTGIVARDQLDIRTGNHTQLDGALLASDSGNLKLDTGTLGFRDIEGHDREHAWYINAGGTYSWGGDGGSGGQPADGNAAATGAVVDPSQQNKDGSNNWNLSGYDYRREREQIVRATVGEGEIVVRSDADTGRDSTAGLNRDVIKAYEVTKDKEDRTDLYVSKSSVEAVAEPGKTLEQWKSGAENYGRNSVEAFTNLSALKEHARSAAEHDKLVAALAWAPELLIDAMDAMGTPTLGIFPGAANHGGLISQLPILVTGDLQPLRVTGTFKTDTEGKLVLEAGKPVLDSESLQVQQFAGFNEEEDRIFTNGIMNSMMAALSNGLMQSGSGNGGVSFVLAYNPTHGLIGDLIESAFDKNLQGAIRSGTARNLNGLFQQGIDAGPDALHIYGHSQGGLLTWVAIKGLDFSNGGSPTATLNTIQLSGAPVDAKTFHDDAEAAGFESDDQRAFQVNRPDETVFFGLLPKTDTVSDLPLFLGGNAKYSDDPVERTLGALFTALSLFGEGSPHSNYSCVTCPPSAPGSVDAQVRDIVINPTLIDGQGNARGLE